MGIADRQWLVLADARRFFVAGLALSLTPCVLPMVPILSSIIAGQGGTGLGAAAASCSR